MTLGWQLFLAAIAIVLGYTVSGLIKDDRMTDVVYRFLLTVGALSTIYVFIVN